MRLIEADLVQRASTLRSVAKPAARNVRAHSVLNARLLRKTLKRVPRAAFWTTAHPLRLNGAAFFAEKTRSCTRLARHRLCSCHNTESTAANSTSDRNSVFSGPIFRTMQPMRRSKSAHACCPRGVVNHHSPTFSARKNGICVLTKCSLLSPAPIRTSQAKPRGNAKS